MDSFEIFITPDAESDLLEIRDDIAYMLLVPEVALDYMQAIRREIKKLSYLATSIAPIDIDRNSERTPAYRGGSFLLQREQRH